MKADSPERSLRGSDFAMTGYSITFLGVAICFDLEVGRVLSGILQSFLEQALKSMRGEPLHDGNLWRRTVILA